MLLKLEAFSPSKYAISHCIQYGPSIRNQDIKLCATNIVPKLWIDRIAKENPVKLKSQINKNTWDILILKKRK